MIVSTVLGLTLGAFALLCYAWAAVAQVFLAVLFGIFISELADRLRRWARLSHGAAVTLTIAVLLLAAALLAWSVGTLGMIIATPLAAAGIVLVRRLYLQAVQHFLIRK